MSLWPITSPEYPREVFGSCTPEEVLLEHDQPLTFTFRDHYGRLLLAHLADEAQGRARYIVAAMNDRLIAQLKSGSLSIREALDQPATWVVEVDQGSGSVAVAWSLSLADLPAGLLPGPHVLLYPDLERDLAFNEEGVIDEADKGQQTFTLREVPGLGEQKCRYDAQITSAVMQAFVSGRRVRVVGVRPRASSVVSATQIRPAGSPATVVQA
jgi:hypothetical protein